MLVEPSCGEMGQCMRYETEGLKTDEPRVNLSL